MKRITLSCILFLFAIVTPTSLADKPPEQLAASSPIEAASDMPLAKIAPDLLKQFATQSERNATSEAEPVTFLVYMAERADLSDAAMAASASLRKQSVVEALQETARVSQVSLQRTLDQQASAGHVTKYTSYWVFNGMVVDGNLDAALAIAALPEVAYVRPNRVHQLAPQPEAEGLSFESDLWNITKINAPQVWQTYGVTGEGVVVANMDSGVDWTHPALQQAYRGYDATNPPASEHDYNWYDPTGTYPTAPGPNEAYAGNQSDHGTHCMGSVLGATQDGAQTYGVAPGATWIATKAFTDDGGSTDAWIHACFQWIMAPTDLNGQNADPSRAPDILSCSWGNDDGSDIEFAQDVAALRAAGILSVWAGGNEGPGDRTINAPGCINGELSVGATTSSDGVASFSSRGPSPYGELKPDVSAPGVSILSTIAGGGTSSWQGTSMATPQVAGLAALIAEASDHSLSVTETQFVITSTVVDLGTAGKDNEFGWGRIDALAAIEYLVASGTISGTVRQESDGEPISGAQVVALDGQTTVQSATTDADGHYQMHVPEGQVDVQASAFGYQPKTVTGVTVSSGAEVTVDLELVRLPYGTLSLSLSREADGTPCGGVVSLVGLGMERVVGASGQMTWQLPEGTYDLEVRPVDVGLRGATASDVTVIAGQTTPLAIQLSSAPSILFVHGDAWYGQDTLSYYGASLDALLYGYDVYETTTRYDVPTTSALDAYDLVIWSNSDSSPGYMNGWDELSSYLDDGGALLLSGQDIGYWDDDGESSYYRRYLHAEFATDTAQEGALVTTEDGPWQGIDLTINDSSSAQNQVSPDGLVAADSLAQVIASYPDGNGAALAIDACTYRAIYAGFGLEGAGGFSGRTDAIEQAILWLGEPATSGQILADLAPIYSVAAPGESATAQVAVTNRAVTAQGIEILIDSPWPATVFDASGEAISRIDSLGTCASQELSVLVNVPLDANIGDEATVTLTFTPDDLAIEPTVATMTVLVQNVWQDGPDAFGPLYRAASVADDCSVIVASGYADAVASSNVWQFDVGTGASTTLTTMPVAAPNASAVLIDRKLYVLGGYDSDASAALDNVQVYDLEKATWSDGPSLPTPLSGLAAAAIGSDIYVMGGNTGGAEAVATGYVLHEGVWTPIAPMPGAADFGQAVALDGMIYYAGGWSSLNTLWRYDPATDAWETLAPMLQGRQSFVFDTDGVYLYAAGGGDGWTGLGSVERYDPAADTWITLPSLANASRSGACGAIAGGHLVVLGGTGDQNATTVEMLDVGMPLAASRMDVSATEVRNGETLTYTLYLKNPSSQAVPASLSLTLPDGLEPPYTSPGDCVVGAGQPTVISWQGDIQADTVQEIIVSAPIADMAEYGHTFTATAVISEVPCVGALELTSTSRLIEPSLHASTASVDPTTASPSDTLHYEIQVINASPFGIADAEVVSQLPAQVDLLAGTLVGGDYTSADHTVRWQGEIALSPSATGFSWRDASGGQSVADCDDCCSTELPLGFEFTFYGTSYSEIVVSSNGTVLFGGCDHSYSNGSLPSSQMSYGMVAPFWDDLNPNRGGAVYFEVQGEAPNRVAVVSWVDVPSYGSTDTQTFQALLFEGSNGIICQYRDMNGDRGTGSSATVGLQSPDGTTANQYLYDGQPAEHLLHDELAIVLEQPSTNWNTSHTITFDAQIDQSPATNQLVCRTTIADGLHLFDRNATTILDIPAGFDLYLPLIGWETLGVGGQSLCK